MDYGIYLVFTLFFSKLFSLIFTLKTRLTNFRAVRTNRPHFLTNAVNNFVPNHRRTGQAFSGRAGRGIRDSSLFRQICGNSACSHKACRNSLWEQRLFPQSLSEQLFPQICRNRLLGVPIENKCVKGGGLLYGGLI